MLSLEYLGPISTYIYEALYAYFMNETTFLRFPYHYFAYLFASIISYGSHHPSVSRLLKYILRFINVVIILGYLLFGGLLSPDGIAGSLLIYSYGLLFYLFIYFLIYYLIIVELRNCRQGNG